MTSTRLVVIGGDAAGMSAASQARRRRRRRPRDRGLRAGPPHVATRPAGSRTWSAARSSDLDELVARTPGDVPRRARHRRAAPPRGRRIDWTARAVRGARPATAARTEREPFDQLVVAHRRRPGPARPARQSTPTGIYGVQTLDDGVAILRALDAERASAPRRGGRRRLHRPRDGRGAACSAALRGDVVERAAQPMAHARPRHGRAGRRRDARAWASTCAPGERSRASTRRTAGVTAVVTDERTLPADLVVLGLGVRPEQRRWPQTPGIADRRRPAASRPTGACARRVRAACGRPATASRPSTSCPGQPVAIALGTARQQAGPRGGHQHRRRLRHLPRRRRHRGHQGLRATRSPAPA